MQAKINSHLKQLQTREIHLFKLGYYPSITAIGTFYISINVILFLTIQSLHSNII